VKFCGECGTPLAAAVEASDGRAAAPEAASGREEPVAERRLVSVLFADLVGFTTLSESRDSEEVRELLSRYFDTSRRIIGRFGGTVEKFIGDAVMAVWGTPVATEDDAERAVRAALDLTAAVAALGEETGVPDLRARAGVLTGEAAVTIGAEAEGMVAGDLVNTAARIQSVAEPGAVLVGEATRRATEAAFVYEDAGTFELKGKAGLVPLWRAARVISGVRGTLKSVGLEPPFVGRDRELRLVKDLFHASADERTAHLVSVLGIAGIGKSRLAWEFYKYFDGLAEDTWWHRGRCLSYGEGVTYWALAEMVKMRARISEDEDPASAFEKLRATLAENVADPEERRWIEPRLAHLLGLQVHTAADKEDLFAGWRLFFERLAEQLPVVMVFEDMQWADSALLDFIEYLLEWSRSFPIFVMTLARPELTDRRPTWGAGKRNFTSLYLEPLPMERMHDLVSGFVAGLPAETEEQILQRSAGVPLYAVETVRMLLDRGLLVQDGTVYRPTGPIETLEVPETLHALIAARLDGLTPDERRAVQDASVLGKTFFEAGLASVTGIDEHELQPLLTALVRKEILTVQADPRSPERGQYGFLQDLLRTVAYETLSKKERRARHLAAAEFLERTAADEDDIVEVVASHYLHAFEALPEAEDAPAIRERARTMLTKAGEHAASLAAADEAQRYFERAIELTDEDLALAELHERTGQMAKLAGRLPQALEQFEQAIRTFDAIGLTHPSARVAAAVAEIVWQDGRIAEAAERMRSAFEILADEEEDADLATLAAQLGRVLYFMGRPDEALERIELALTIAEALRLPEVLSEALNTRGLILTTRGRIEEGTLLLRRSLEIALEHDLSASALRALNNLAAQAGNADRFAEVIELSRQGLDLARRVGDRLWEQSFSFGDLEEHVNLGRWDEAEERAQQIRPEEGLPEFLRMSALNLVPMHVWRGELDEARRVLAGFPEAESSGDVQTRTAYRRCEAQVLRAEGRLPEAMAAGEEAFAARLEFGIQAGIVKEGLVQALEAAFELGDEDKLDQLLGDIEALRPGEVTPYLRTQGARFAAKLAARRGESDRVEPSFAAAAEGFRELSMPFHVAVTQLELGEWLVSSDRAEEARGLFTEAREVFERLRARPWIEQIDRVAAGIAAEAHA
jgi:class 3 adenylate cyclase/tetratricopeptide (TPR) repeat protein